MVKPNRVLKKLKTITEHGNERLLPWLVLETILGRDRLFSLFSQNYKVRNVLGQEMILDVSYKGITRDLFIEGIREGVMVEEFQQGVAELLDGADGDILFLDIGANIGYYTLQAASMIEDRGRIYAIEPHPANRNLLEANRIINGFQDEIEVVDVAMGGRNGTGNLSLSSHGNYHTLMEEKTFPERFAGETMEVELRTVTSFLRNREIPPRDVDIVRMDVEGYESEILKGMKSVLQSTGPLLLFIEVHPNLTDTEYVIETLKDAGMEIQAASKGGARRVDPKSLDEIDRYDCVKLILLRETT